MSGIGLCLANLLALLLESIVYGLFLSLYLFNLIIANEKPTIPVPRQRMFQVSTLMLAMATAHLAISFVRVAKGFRFRDDGFDPAFFGELQEPMYKAKNTIFFLQTTMADALVTWRCFIIYEKRRWILIPGIVAILLDIVTLIIRLLPAIPTLESPGMLPLIPLACRLAFLSTTMTLHLAYSTAIVVKIYLRRRSLQRPSRSLSPVVTSIIESAAIYTIIVFILLICSIIKSNGQFVIMDIIVPLVGVVFCMIAIRIRFYLRASPEDAIDRGVSTNPWSAPTLSETTVGEEDEYPMRERNQVSRDPLRSSMEQRVSQTRELTLEAEVTRR